MQLHWSIVWVGYLLTWGAIPHIFLRNKPPVSTLAWVWAVILFPYIGPLCYFLFGSGARRTQEAAGQPRDGCLRRPGGTPHHRLHPLPRGKRCPTPSVAAVELLSAINDLAVSSVQSTRLLVGGRAILSRARPADR
ncbi:MAG: PLDc N-terminal domain-containing protein [Chthoniobacter sp.]